MTAHHVRPNNTALEPLTAAPLLRFGPAQWFVRASCRRASRSGGCGSAWSLWTAVVVSARFTLHILRTQIARLSCLRILPRSGKVTA